MLKTLCPYKSPPPISLPSSPLPPSPSSLEVDFSSQNKPINIEHFVDLFVEFWSQKMTQMLKSTFPIPGIFRVFWPIIDCASLRNFLPIMKCDFEPKRCHKYSKLPPSLREHFFTFLSNNQLWIWTQKVSQILKTPHLKPRKSLFSQNETRISSIFPTFLVDNQVWFWSHFWNLLSSKLQLIIEQKSRKQCSWREGGSLNICDTFWVQNHTSLSVKNV